MCQQMFRKISAREILCDQCASHSHSILNPLELFLPSVHGLFCFVNLTVKGSCSDGTSFCFPVALLSYFCCFLIKSMRGICVTGEACGTKTPASFAFLMLSSHKIALLQQKVLVDQGAMAAQCQTSYEGLHEQVRHEGCLFGGADPFRRATDHCVASFACHRLALPL